MDSREKLAELIRKQGNELVDQLSAALTEKKVKHLVQMTTGDQKVIKLEDVYFPIKVDTVGRTWSWSAPKETKFAISVGGYGEVRRFPQRKTGFPFAEIADHVVAELKRRRDREAGARKHEREQKKLDKAVHELEQEFKLRPHVRCSIERSLDVSVELSGLNLEQLRAVLEALAPIRSVLETTAEAL